MATHKFYYDEAEHSRKITYNTVTAKNYYDNFVTAIVGWSSEEKILQQYSAFEKKYEKRQNSEGEIKSTTLNQCQFGYGFASLSKENVQFVSDFLSIFDKDSHICFSVGSKIEYLVLQLFKDYRDNPCVDINLMKYSIIKALVMYQPNEVIRSLYQSPKDFLEILKKFFQDRIEYNKQNPKLKYRETKNFECILYLLNEIPQSPTLNWNYCMPFEGFKKYLKENKIGEYILTIDKEGMKNKESETLKAASEVGLHDLQELNSMQCQGLRVADMMVGIISKLLKALSRSIQYKSLDDGINKKILDSHWFVLDKDKLGLYKKIYQIIYDWQPSSYKFYSGIYSDDLILFEALLKFMNEFNLSEHIDHTNNKQGKYFNAFACQELEKYFDDLRLHKR